MKKKLLFLLLSFIFPVIAFAQDSSMSSDVWSVYYAMPEDDDIDTIHAYAVYSRIEKEVRYGSKYYKVWEREFYGAADGTWERTRSEILCEYNESFTKFRYLCIISYDDDGNVTGSYSYDNYPEDWNYISPKSIGEAAVKMIKYILNAQSKR